jgi:hypothetical protein
MPQGLGGGREILKREEAAPESGPSLTARKEMV